jgi:hypothetical protein
VRWDVERVSVDERGVLVCVSQDELSILKGALNEVCNGIAIEDWEFSTRLGVGRPEARRLLAELGAVIESLAADV